MPEIQITPADIAKIAQVMADLSTAFQSVGQECSTIGTDVGNAANDASGAAKAIEKGASEVFDVLGKAFTLFDKLCGKSSTMLTDYVNNLTKLDSDIATTVNKIKQYSGDVGQAATNISNILSSGH